MAEYSLTHVDESSKTFKVILIPAALEEKVQEVEVVQPAGEAIGCLMAFIKQRFTSKLTKAQELVYHEHIRKEAKGQALDPTMMQHLTGTTMVDIIMLDRNSRGDNVGVNMYVDDKGVSKQLPTNTRATAIAQMVGVQVMVLGDTYIARQFDNDEGFCRLDFTMEDLSSSAKWVQSAKAHNEKHASVSGTAARGVTAHNLLKPKQATPTRTPLEVKELGNKLFKQKDFSKAHVLYTMALKLLEKQDVVDEELRGVLLSNRCACFTRLKRFDEAISDGKEVVKARPDWAKGVGRLGDAYAAAKLVDKARETYDQALGLAPGDKSLEARKAKLV